MQASKRFLYDFLTSTHLYNVFDFYGGPRFEIYAGTIPDYPEDDFNDKGDAVLLCQVGTVAAPISLVRFQSESSGSGYETTYTYKLAFSAPTLGTVSAGGNAAWWRLYVNESDTGAVDPVSGNVGTYARLQGAMGDGLTLDSNSLITDSVINLSGAFYLKTTCDYATEAAASGISKLLGGGLLGGVGLG